MICPRCGRPVEDGTTFCRHCGTRLEPGATEGAGGARPPYPEATAVRGGRTGLVVGAVAAAVILLAGLGVGLYVGLRGDDTDGAGVTETVADAVGAAEQNGDSDTGSGDSGGGTGGEVILGATTETGQDSSGTTGAPVTTGAPAMTTTTVDALAAWSAVHDELVMELEYADVRIPELAEQINSTAPDVPDSVWEELAAMGEWLGGLRAALAATPAPADYEIAHARLLEAADHMVKRIAATLDGIATMWYTGSIGLATEAFNTGRAERDAYREAMAEHWGYMPST